MGRQHITTENCPLTEITMLNLERMAHWNFNFNSKNGKWHSLPILITGGGGGGGPNFANAQIGAPKIQKAFRLHRPHSFVSECEWYPYALPAQVVLTMYLHGLPLWNGLLSRCWTYFWHYPSLPPRHTDHHRLLLGLTRPFSLPEQEDSLLVPVTSN